MDLINEYFTFSPGARAVRALIAAVNFGIAIDEAQCRNIDLCKILYSTNPFNNWLLCGVNGSCINLEPMAMLGGGEHRIIHCKTDKGKDSPNNKIIKFKLTPVCVYPPFVFIVSNSTQVLQNVLTCLSKTCLYTQCWDSRKADLAVIARMPRWVPVPVEAPHALSLFRQRRDFRITAAIVAAISLAAVGATAAAVAMS